MSISKNLETIYYNGQPDGIRSIRQHLSTMTTYVIPRPLLSEAKKISGTNRPGIYYLISENDDNRIAQIYIGQTRNGIIRLDDHNRSKDFWNKAIMFLADKKTFSLDMISGLEAYAINKAHETKRYQVDNTANPKYEIDEYDLPLIEQVYEEIKFIMATQGYKMANASTGLKQDKLLHTTRNGITAFGTFDGETFKVLAGSQVDTSRPCVSKAMEAQRQNAIQNGDILLEGKVYKLQVSMSFRSPSSAALFVLGGSTNGWVEWRNEEGKTLDEIYRRKEAPPENKQKKESSPFHFLTKSTAPTRRERLRPEGAFNSVYPFRYNYVEASPIQKT